MTQTLIQISERLGEATHRLSFGEPVAAIYNPLIYGREAHTEYLSRFGRTRGGVLLLGMNPGPWGMIQTAVPFGAVRWVRDWMKLAKQVGRPPTMHPKRKVEGFACPRNEVSGDRLWTWASEHFGEPESFFRHFFVWNYCPLSFMVASGANLVPEKLLKAERDPLFKICDHALIEVVDALSPRMVIGVGKFAADRARAVVGHLVAIGQILHPSPASPAANRGWAPVVTKQLIELGVLNQRSPNA